jgi:hypothetical protein
MTLVEQWCGKNPSFGHLHVFGCVSWAHISNYYIKNLDAKSHACIMMGYSGELKYYQLFDPIKWKTIIIHNVWFDEKSFGIKLLNVSSLFLQDNPFDVVPDSSSHVPYFNPSTRQSNFDPISIKPSSFESTSPLLFVSIDPSSPSTEIILTSK